MVRGSATGDGGQDRYFVALVDRRLEALCAELAVRKPHGVEGKVYVADDLDGVGRMRSTAKLPGFKPSDWPILAAGKVKHVGEPVAMAIGATPAEAEDLAALVEIDYEALTPVVTMDDALKKQPPFVHDEWGDNVLVDLKLENGDIAAAKAAAAHVVERSFRMNRMHPLALEGRACLASYNSRLDELVVYVAHQLPVPLQIGLSQVLGISQRRLRVIAPDVGASFGLKTYVESETVCVAWAAMQLRRPVRWIQDRYESLVCDANCRDYRCRIVGYADANGRVLGLECDVTVDSGAYSPWPWPAGIEGGLALGNIQGCYDIRALARPCAQHCQQQAGRAAVPRGGAAAVVHRPRDRHGWPRRGGRDRSGGDSAAQFRASRSRCRTCRSPRRRSTAATTPLRSRALRR